MSTVLDLRTLLLLAGVFYMVLPLVVWLTLGMPRAAGTVLWCVGGLVGGVGFGLMGLRGEIPDQLSYLLGQPVLVLGALMAAQGLRMDLNKPWPWTWLIMSVIAYALLLAWLLQTVQAATLGVVIRMANLATVLTLVHASWQVSRAEASRHALTISIAYGIQALAILMNLTSAWLGSADIHTMQGGITNQLAYLIMIMVAMVGAMAYLGLALERSTASALQMTQETLRREQWRNQRQTLAQADRSHILNLLTESISQAMLQPLTAAALNLELARRAVRDNLQDPGPPGQWLDQVVADILNANATVDRIRALIRPAKRNAEVFKLGAVVHDLQQLVRTQAISQRTALHLEQGPPDVELQGDRITLTHGLLELLHNALAAVRNSPAREVSLRVWREDDWVGIRICDSGPGFADDLLKSFSSRIEPSKTSLQGIGLDVVRGIVKQHRGRISLDNPPSGGACVTMLLPRID